MQYVLKQITNECHDLRHRPLGTIVWETKGRDRSTPSVITTLSDPLQEFLPPVLIILSSVDLQVLIPKET